MLTEDQLITEEIKIYRAIKALRLAQLGAPALRIITERLNILPYLEYFFKHNQSAAEYHSNYHAVCVALNVYEGAWHEKLSESETRSLVLAGIFHDFNHSGGTMTDDKNIEKAIHGVSSAYIEEVEFETSLTTEEFSQTIQTLAITKYPYEKDPVTIMEQIIRDADLMQPYEEDDLILEMQYKGLHTEIERAYPMKFTSSEFANGQRSWLDTNVKWYSNWATTKAVVLSWKETKQRLFEIMNGA